MSSSIITSRYDQIGTPSFDLNPLQRQQISILSEKYAQGVYRRVEAECPCESENADIIAERDRFGCEVRNIICKDCGLIRISPRPHAETYKQFYLNEYRKLYTGREDQQNIQQIFDAQYESGRGIYNLCDRVGVFSGNDQKKVLEIGCSCGGNLAYFRDQGHAVTGLDYDETYLNFGRGTKNLNLAYGGLDELKPKDSFDLIILSHVFEHFPDPMAAISTLSSHCRAGGFIYIHVPGVRFEPYYRRPPFDFVSLLQEAHPFTYTYNTLLNLFIGSDLVPIYGDEDVRVIFRRGDGSRPGPDLQQPVNEYNDIVAYIRGIEKRRLGRMFHHRLNAYRVVRALKRLFTIGKCVLNTPNKPK